MLRWKIGRFFPVIPEYEEPKSLNIFVEGDKVGHGKFEEDSCESWWLKRGKQKDGEEPFEGLRGRAWIRDPDSMNLDFFEPVWFSFASIRER